MWWEKRKTMPTGETFQLIMKTASARGPGMVTNTSWHSCEALETLLGFFGGQGSPL